MEDYIPRNITVSELDPGHRFYFFGQICEILLITKEDNDFYTILFDVRSGTENGYGKVMLKGTSDFTILLNKE